MVFAKLALLAIIACLCQLSQAQTLRRTRPGCTTCAVPRVTTCAPAPCRPPTSIGARYRYECNLENIITKLIRALIYIILQKDGGLGSIGPGGSGSGSSGSSGSLLSLDADLGGTDLLNLDVLPESSGDASGGKKSGGLSLLELEVLERIFLNLGLGRSQE